MQGVQALIATANRRLAEWACERLQAAEITVCEEAADLESAVLLAVELRPDVCLLDVAIPGDAIAALQRIRERAPTTRVVMLAAADDPALLPAVHAGANGCMIGTPDGPALARALADVLAGRAALPRGAADATRRRARTGLTARAMRHLAHIVPES